MSREILREQEKENVKDGKLFQKYRVVAAFDVDAFRVSSKRVNRLKIIS